MIFMLAPSASSSLQSVSKLRTPHLTTGSTKQLSTNFLICMYLMFTARFNKIILINAVIQSILDMI